MDNIPDNQINFSFQKRFLYLEIMLHIIIGSVFIISWFPAIVSIISYNVIITSAIRAAIYLNATAIALLILFLFFKKEISKYKVIVCTDKLIFKTPYKISSVSFYDITSINITTIPFIRGYLKITTEYKTLIVPLFVEQPEMLIRSVQDGISHCGKTGLLNDDSIKKIKKKLLNFEISYSRSVNSFSTLSRSCLYMIFINVFIAKEVWGTGLIPILLWAISGMFFPPVVYAFTEWKNNLFSKTAPLLINSEEYILSGFLLFPLYLISGILFRSFFQ